VNSEPSSADLLGAATLLLAALAVLYGVWYSSIEAAKSRTIPTHASDAAKPLASVRAVLRGRAYPLALASGLSAMVFAPEAINIVAETVRTLHDYQFSAFQYYDPIEAALRLVTVGLSLLTVHVGCLCAALQKKTKRWRQVAALNLCDRTPRSIQRRHLN
jgi:hypothetical protein